MRVCPSCGYNTPIDTVERCPLDGKPLTRKGPTGDPMIGRKIADRFLIEERIGKGGMGTVYKAKQLSIDRTVALKVVRNPGDDELVERFQREARYISRVSDPHVVTLFDFGQAEDGILFIAMEFLHGESLANRIQRASKLTPLEACDLARQVCEALSAAHAKGIVHRDLKPDNIYFAQDDSGEGPKEIVKVLDFGLAKAFRDELRDQSLTNVGDVFGTPLYMSPEQVRGEAVDHRTDLYALGVVLYEALTGTPPFRGASVHETLHMHVATPPEALNARRPGLQVPQRLERVLFSMLAKERDIRPANTRVARRYFDELYQELSDKELRTSGRQGVSSIDQGMGLLSSDPPRVSAAPMPRPELGPSTLTPVPRASQPRRPEIVEGIRPTDTQPIAAEVTPTPLLAARVKGARFGKLWFVGVGVGGVAVAVLLAIMLPSSDRPGSTPLGATATGGPTAATVAADTAGTAGAAGAPAEPGKGGTEPPQVAAVAAAPTPAPPAVAAPPPTPPGSPARAEVRPAAPSAVPAPRPAAPPAPAPMGAATVGSRARGEVVVQFESSPSGAVIYDGNTKLFPTPFKLTVQRSRDAKKFVARLAGQPDQKLTVTLNQSQSVRFKFPKAVVHHPGRRKKVEPGSKPTKPAASPAGKPRFGDHPVNFGD